MATSPGLKAAARVRVLYCLDLFEGPSTGGTETQFWMLINRLPREQFSVALALLRPSAWLRANRPEFPVFDVGVNSMMNPRSWWRLFRFARRMRRAGYRIAHIYLNDSSICLPPFLWLAGIRVVISRRDLGFWYTPNILRALRVTRHFVDRVIANCTAVAEVTVREEHYARQSIDVVFNGFSRVPAEPASFVTRRETASLVLVANLKAIKRIDIAIHALARLRARGHAATLTLVGGEAPDAEGAEYRAGLERLGRDLGVEPHVIFAGRIADPSALIAGADICLLCSDSEGLSNAIIEYMFGGAAIVCTDVGGARDLIDPGVTGVLVPPGDPEKLADAVAALLDDPH
ncbi:MAG TPA: glycosyltransferase, partial [Steroidobacteraceae bacterium]